MLLSDRNYQSSHHSYQPSSSEIITFTSGSQENKVEIIKKLGEGAYGQVMLGEDERGKLFAIKKVICHDASAYYTIAQELETLTSIKHMNIIRLYAIDFIDNVCAFVMEYCPCGSLNERLERPVPSNIQSSWMIQLADALSYLHYKRIIHRNLKPENILLKNEETLKLADFGIARKFYKLARGIQPQQMGSNEYLLEYLNPEDRMGTFTWTPYWIAPEVFDLHYDEKADVFSLGVIFYAIATRSRFEFDGKK